MGFIPGIDTQIEAFLTEKGANQLLTSGIAPIKYFAISDDAANYATSQALGLNEMFTLGGKYLIDGKQLSIVSVNTLESKVFVDSSSELYKSFESDSGIIFLEQNIDFKHSINEAAINQYIVDGSNTSSPYINWIKDLKLSYGSADSSLWSTTYSNGGYSDTSIADMNTDDFLFFVINGTEHAYVDGKSIKFSIPFFSGSVDCYSSYLTTSLANSFYDSQNTDISSYLTRFGGNAVLLFCDRISTPNSDATKSWATGYEFDNSPYSQGNKSLANFNAIPGRNMDQAVGICFLDKGVIVIFNSVLYNGYVNRSIYGLTLTNNNLIKRMVSNFICDLPISKFYRSQNSTFVTGNAVRISSVGLYNADKELMAIGRFNSQVEKNKGKRLTILVKIVI